MGSGRKETVYMAVARASVRLSFDETLEKVWTNAIQVARFANLPT